MTKTKTVIVSILLIISALIISKLNNAQEENDLFGFFSGIAFGSGFVLLIQTVFSKKTDTNQ